MIKDQYSFQLYLTGPQPNTIINYAEGSENFKKRFLMNRTPHIFLIL